MSRNRLILAFAATAGLASIANAQFASIRTNAGGADADALLAATLPQAVELRAIEEAAEDLGRLRAHDARAVVLHCDAEARLGELHDLHQFIRQGVGAEDFNPYFLCEENVLTRCLEVPATSSSAALTLTI